MKILNFSFPALLTTYPYYFTLSAHEVRDAGKDKTGKPMSLKKIDSMIKFGFSEKVIKFEKNLCHTFDKSVVFCARNSVLVKKLTIQTFLAFKSHQNTFELF